MKEGNTTLSVSKEFAQTLRNDYDGRNDKERLESWAKQFENDSYNKDITENWIDELAEKINQSNNNSITLTEIESAVESALKSNLSDRALDRY